MREAAVRVVAMLLLLGIVASLVGGTLLPLLPTALAAWAAWIVARSLNDEDS